MTLHAELIDQLSGVASKIRLVASLKDARLGFASPLDMRIFLPDMHVLSAATRQRYNYGTNDMQLLADVLKAGITRLSNLQFMDSQVRKHRDEARRMAIRAAKEKATLLAGEIGQSIGPAYSITEYTPDYGRASATYQNATTTAGGESSDSESAIAPGSISITAQVTVRFRLQ